MAAGTQDENPSTNDNAIGFPNEIVSNILLQSSTPTFLQLVYSSKELYAAASQDRKVLLHHLFQVPGNKTTLEDGALSNDELFLLLRQRATNHLYGANFAADMTEYVVKNTSIDAAASSISGLAADYVRTALVFKDGTDIRQYTNNCLIKEILRQPPGMKILKMVQWNRFISLLCAFPRENEEDFSDDTDSDSDVSETEVLDKNPFPLTANARLTKFSKSLVEPNHPLKLDAPIKVARPKREWVNKYVYRIAHIDIYTMEDSETYEVDGYRDFVPRDFAVQSTQHCAILWDKDTPHPTNSFTVVRYLSADSQPFLIQKYTATVIWPKASTPKPRNTSRNAQESSDDENELDHPPERIAFFKDGRRIKLYHAGGAVPFKVFHAHNTFHDTYVQTNILKYTATSKHNALSFHIDTSFFGMHATHWDDSQQQSYCYQSYLCLGVSKIDTGSDDSEEGIRVLCILRSEGHYYPESCDHRVSHQRMPHMSATSATVVARLWGWEELHTNLTGHDTISISPGGTRIAVAMWNKVYVYPLNPKVLCEEQPVRDDDDSKLKKKKKKPHRPWEKSASDYYERKTDRNMQDWKITELKPIVLDLNGAIAKKMNWSRAKAKITDTGEIENEGPRGGPVVDVVVIDDGESVSASSASSSEATAEEIENIITVQTTAELINPDVTAVEPATEVAEPNGASATNETTEHPDTEAKTDTAGPEVESRPDTAPRSEQQTVEEDVKASIPVNQPVNSPPKPELPSSTPSPSGSPHSTASDESAPFGTITNGSKDLNISSQSPAVSSTLPTMPLSPQQTTNFHEVPKPSPRKKEKSPDTTSFENIPLSLLAKYKSQTGYSSFSQQDQRLAEEISAPLSPVMSKNVLKHKQTVSEILSAKPNTVQPKVQKDQPSQPQPADTNVPSSTPKEEEVVVEIKPTDEPASEALAVPKTGTEPEVASAVEEIPFSTEAGNTETQDAAQKQGTEETEPVTEAAADAATAKHRARITEDELTIMTDRGIQVWYLGAKCAGKREKKLLPIEETLRGKIPTQKGKHKG